MPADEPRVPVVPWAISLMLCIVGAMIWTVVGFFSAGFAVIAPMLMDSGGADSILLNMVVWGLLTFPIVSIVSVLGSLFGALTSSISFYFQARIPTFLLSAIGLLSALLPFLSIAVIAIGWTGMATLCSDSINTCP